MLKRLAAFVGIFCALVSVVAAADTPSVALLVLNKGDTSLVIVDPQTLAVVGRVFAGQDPHEVIASADGRTAFVSNYGGFGAGFHTLSVIDLVAQKQMPVVDLGALRSPHGLAIADGKIYFTAEGSKVIGRYDPAAGKIDWVLGLGQDRTHMIVVSKDGKKIFTSNVNSNTISILEPGTGKDRGPFGPNGPPPGFGGPGAKDGPPGGGPPGGGPPGGGFPAGGPPGGWIVHSPNDWTETFVKVGNGPEGFDVSPDGKELWAANSHDGTVSVIDIEKKSVAATLNVPTRMANRLKFTPDGKQVFISDLGGDGVVVLDAATRKEIKRISLNGGSAGILMQPDGARVYVASGNGVSVIDLKTLAVAGRVETGRNPDGLGWAVRN